ASFLASLNVQADITRLDPGSAALERVEELFKRTTQFNATGAKFTAAELSALIQRGGAVFSVRVSDRFGDHGLTGAAVIEGGDILGLAMSCRVLGLGVEHSFLQHVLQALGADH